MYRFQTKHISPLISYNQIVSLKAIPEQLRAVWILYPLSVFEPSLTAQKLLKLSPRL